MRGSSPLRAATLSGATSNAAVAVLRVRERVEAGAVAARLGGVDEPPRVAEREGAEEERVDEREDRRRRPHADGERRDGEGGERGAPPELAEREAQVPTQDVHPEPPGLVDAPYGRPGGRFRPPRGARLPVARRRLGPYATTSRCRLPEEAPPPR